MQASLRLKTPGQVKVSTSKSNPTLTDVAQHLLFEKLRTLELDDEKIAEATSNMPEAVKTRQRQLPEAKRQKADVPAVQEPFEREGLEKLHHKATRDARLRAVPLDPNNQTPAPHASVNIAVHGERVGLKGWVQYHAHGSQAIAVKVLLDTIVALGVQSMRSSTTSVREAPAMDVYTLTEQEHLRIREKLNAESALGRARV